MKNKTKFDSCEIVKVHSNRNEMIKYNGHEGAIVGKAEPRLPGQQYSYAVDYKDTCVMFYENELISTNKFEAPKEDSVDSIKVYVNEKGEGYSPDTDGSFDDADPKSD